MDMYKLRHTALGVIATTALLLCDGYAFLTSHDVSTENESISKTYEYSNCNEPVSASYLTKAETHDVNTFSLDDVTYENDAFIYLTDNEIQMLATLVNLESGVESYDCQRDVASVIINRMIIENSSLEEIIYSPGQFEPAYMISYSEPTKTSLKAVEDVIQNGTTLPIYVTYFRAGYYHEWGDLVGYRQYENTYFSYSTALKEQYE